MRIPTHKPRKGSLPTYLSLAPYVTNEGKSYASLMALSRTASPAGGRDFADNTWQHFAMTVSNNSSGNWTISNYINGSLYSTKATTTLGSTSSYSYLGSGQTDVMGYAGDSNFKGYVDDFRVYSSALTAT